MKWAHILNNITCCLCLLIVGGIAIMLTLKMSNEPKVYNYIELKNNYKNCIIVGKDNFGGVYKLKLCNPFLHENGLSVDYNIYVKDYIYFHNFIGDTIK